MGADNNLALGDPPNLEELVIAETEPVKTEPVKTEPVKTEPVKTEPVKTDIYEDKFKGFDDRFSKLEKFLEDKFGVLTQKQQKESPNYFKDAVSNILNERESNSKKERLQQHYALELANLQSQFADDFKDGKLIEEMEKVIKRGLTPNDLFWITNKNKIIEREKTAAVQSFRDELLKRSKLASANGRPAQEINMDRKSDGVKSFDDVANEEFEKYVIGQ